jgi:hypothetical protein
MPRNCAHCDQSFQPRPQVPNQSSCSSAGLGFFGHCSLQKCKARLVGGWYSHTPLMRTVIWWVLPAHAPVATSG